jgi:hypothetical protein
VRQKHKLSQLTLILALGMAGNATLNSAACASDFSANIFHDDNFDINEKLLGAESTYDPASVLMTQGSSGHRGLELVEAALLPGLHQARHGDWLKASAFVLVEVGALLAIKNLNDKGEELDAEFLAYADEHWSYERYWRNRVEVGEYAHDEPYWDRGISWDEAQGALYIDPSIWPNGIIVDEEGWLPYYGDSPYGEVRVPGPGEVAGGHVLPGYYRQGTAGDFGSWEHLDINRTQQFYEMIGKYGQFQRGWDDYGLDDPAQTFLYEQQWSVNYFSANARHYDSIRDKSNDKLIQADRMFGIIIANHVVSFLDVLLKNAGNNKRAEQKTLQKRGLNSNGIGFPDLSVSVTILNTGHVPMSGLKLSIGF